MRSDVQAPNVVCPFQMWISPRCQGVAQWWGAVLGHSNELDPQHYKKERKTNQKPNKQTNKKKMLMDFMDTRNRQAVAIFVRLCDKNFMCCYVRFSHH